VAVVLATAARLQTHLLLSSVRVQKVNVFVGAEMKTFMKLIAE
jgi:hypothetical protein